MAKKSCLLLISWFVIVTLLYSQCVWAIGLETLQDHLSKNPQQYLVTKNLKPKGNLPKNLQKFSPKVFSRFLAIPTEKANFEDELTLTGAKNTLQTCVIPSDNDRLGRVDEKYGTYDGKRYKWQAISYDELGRPTAYKEKYGKVSYRHYDIQYNELGDVSYEKIKVTAKSGGLFKSKTTVVTEYKYGYDEYGQHEKTWENEIYRKTTKSFIAKVFDVIDAVLQIASIFLPYLKPISMIFSLVNQVLQTGDIKGVLLNLAAQALGAMLGGMLTSAGASGGLADFFGQFNLSGAFNAGTSSFGIGAVFKIFNVIDDLVGDLTGETLTQRMFGENAGIARAIFGVLGNLFSPDGMNAYNLIAGLGSIGLEILKRNNPEFANSDLGKFLFSMVDQALNTWASIETREAKVKELEAQGLTVERDKYGRPTYAYQDIVDEDLNLRRDYYSLDGQYLGSDEYISDSDTKLIVEDFFGIITIYDEEGNKLYESGLDSPLLDYDSYFNQGPDSSRLKDLKIYRDDNQEIIAIGILEGNTNTLISPDGTVLGKVPTSAEPVFSQEGKLLYSELQTDMGTISFDLEGNIAGFIPNGFTPVRLEDTIAYSYLPVSENSFLMVDSNGGNLKLVTQKLDSVGIPIGEYITDDTSIAYYDSRGIKIWDRANQPNSTINLYLEDGSILDEITTLVTKSNLVSGYLFDNKLTGETSLYDWAGTLDSMTDAKGDFYQYNEKGEVVLYVPEGFDVRRNEQTQQVIDVIGYDDQGNFISQDPKGMINYKVTAEGDTYFYGIDGRLEAIMYNWDTDTNNLKIFTYFDQFDDMGNLIGSSRLRSDGLVTVLDKDGNEFYSFNLAEIQQNMVLGAKDKLTAMVQNLIERGTEQLDKINIIPESRAIELIPVPQPLLEKLIPLIQNIPQGFSNITDNLLDLITTPVFANNGEVQAQVLIPVPIPHEPTLKDHFLDPLKQAGKEYVEGVNKFNNAVKTLWNKWSNFITPDYSDNTSTWANFSMEVFTGEPIENASEFYWNKWGDLWAVLFLYDASGWDPGVKESTRIITIPGIINLVRELGVESFLINQKEALKQQTGKDIVVVVPLFEHTLLSQLPLPSMTKSFWAGVKDVGLWLSDKAFNIDILTNEIRVKLDKVFAQLSKEAIEKGITLQLYSGSFDTTLEVLNERKLPVKVVVSLGPPSLMGGAFGAGEITNPYMERIVNIWGENDGLKYLLGAVGPKKYTGAEVINIEILDADHGDYLNNSMNQDPASISYKASAFVREITMKAYNRTLLLDYLNKPYASYDPVRDLYTVDLNKLYPEDYR